MLNCPKITKTKYYHFIISDFTHTYPTLKTSNSSAAIPLLHTESKVNYTFRNHQIISHYLMENRSIP